MHKRLILLVAVIGSMMVPIFAYSANPYYQGKTVHMIVAYAAGGGFDIYSRLIARHMGKHLPGNPAIIVDNMPGASGLVTAKHVYGRTKPDGLTIANLPGDLIMSQLMGTLDLDIDIRKFEWVGVPVGDTNVCALSKASGITSMEKWMASKTPVKIGASAGGTSEVPRILKTILNLPMQVIEGYQGTAGIRLATEGGEVAGGFWQWEAIKVMWGQAISAGDMVVVLQLTDKAHPELPKVPLVTNFTKTEEDRRLIKATTYGPARITRLYALAPGTPKELVQTVRTAFSDTLKDPELLAEANKTKLDIRPMNGEETEQAVKEIFNIDPDTLAKLKKLLARGK